MNIEKQNTRDDKAVEELLDLTFGDDRFNKAAYRFREGVDPISDLCFVIRDEAGLVATLKFWPVLIGGSSSLLLGPIAVRPNLQGKGYGISLMKYGLRDAKNLGYKRVILVGDEAYYRRIGFSRSLAQNIIMPLQQDESRLLALDLIPGSFEGIVGKVTRFIC